MPFRSFAENMAVVKCNNLQTALVTTYEHPASGAFIDVSNYDRIVFLIALGTVNDALTFTVHQAATISGSPKALANTAAIVAGSGDSDKWISIEVSTDELDIANGYHFVSLYETGSSGGNDYAAIIFLGYRGRHMPIVQSASYANTAATSPVEIVG